MNNDAHLPIPAFLISYSDSSFTNPHEAMLPDEPADCRGRFTHMGAMYWGYETKRHKATTVLADEGALAYDHDARNDMRIGLKKRASIDTISISTKWFTGNQVRAVSVYIKDELTGKEALVLDRVPLKPDSDHVFEIPPTVGTEARIDCYYEGGISRVSFFGELTPEQMPERPNLLAAAKITHVSNIHYGQPDKAVAGDRKEMHMVGWESARTGFGEQALFHLAGPAAIGEIVVDTYLHRLNPPLTAHVFAVNAAEGEIESLMQQKPRWKVVFADGREVIPDEFQDYMLNQKYLPEKKFKIKLHVPVGSKWKPLLSFGALKPDTYHRFKAADAGAVTHVLYMHYPNGGVHGLKMFGR